MSSKILLAGSAWLQDKIQKRKQFWQDKGWSIVNYPSMIEWDNFLEKYSKVYQNFYKDIEKVDRFFLVNEDKKGIQWYIGAQSFAELSYAVVQNRLYDKNIDIFLAKMPSKQVQSYDEISRWRDLGWINVYNGR